MADKRIDELEEALTITANDLFVLEQANTAKKLSGQTMTAMLTALANGHGGIASIAKTGSAGTDPVVDTYTITYADGNTTTFTVTNGLKGDTGSQGVQGPAGADITITSTSVMYQEWASGVTYPTGTWVTNPPAVAQGNYLWTRTIVNYSDGGQTVAYSVSRMGIDGSGAVSTVCNVSPDGSGNVSLSASDVGALADDYQAPVTSVNAKTGTVALVPSDLNISDYVESKGTTSGWVWYKYNSGRVHLHQRYDNSITVSGSNSVGSLYYTNYVTKALPFEITDYNTTAVISISERGYFAWPVNVRFNSSTEIEFAFMRGTSWNGQTLDSVAISIDGKWK